MPNRSSTKPEIPERSKAKQLYDKQLQQHKAKLLLLVQDVRQILEQQGLTPAIKFRIKSFDAYYDKLRKMNTSSISNRIAAINDFFGLRIVCPFLEDIETVSNLISSHYELLDTERKASQHSFREFGYDSVHLAIRFDPLLSGRLLPGVRKVCEIQLRTILQDAWAEVEHELVYKSDISLPNESIRRKLASLNATLTLSDLIFQEIRDYQHELRQHGRKRREITVQNGHDQESIAISHPTAPSSPARIGPVPSTMASHLEKIMLRALEAHSRHDLDTAIALYGQLLGMRLEPKIRALVYNHRGMAYFALGSHQRALNDFTRAIKHDNNNDRGYANRGLCHRVLKKFDRALADFGHAININPNRPDNYFGRAQAHYDMQEYTLALSDCKKALNIHSGYKPARELIKLLQGDLG